MVSLVITFQLQYAALSSLELSHPIDCLYFADNMIVVTDCLSTDHEELSLSGEVKVVIIEDSDVKESFKFGAAHGVAFPFGLCEMNGEIRRVSYWL